MPSCMRCNYVSPLWGSNYRMPCFIHGLTPVPMIYHPFQGLAASRYGGVSRCPQCIHPMELDTIQIVGANHIRPW